MNDCGYVSREEILKYLRDERGKMLEGLKKENDVIPIDARKGALLSIKAIINFIKQLEAKDEINNK